MWRDGRNATRGRGCEGGGRVGVLARGDDDGGGGGGVVGWVDGWIGVWVGGVGGWVDGWTGCWLGWGEGGGGSKFQSYHREQGRGCRPVSTSHRARRK